MIYMIFSIIIIIILLIYIFNRNRNVQCKGKIGGKYNLLRTKIWQNVLNKYGLSNSKLVLFQYSEKIGFHKSALGEPVL